jgi:hypothetical protein
MDDEVPVRGATDVEFDAVDSEFDGPAEGLDRVFTLADVQSPVGEDGSHESKFDRSDDTILSTLSRKTPQGPLVIGRRDR